MLMTTPRPWVRLFAVSAAVLAACPSGSIPAPTTSLSHARPTRRRAASGSGGLRSGLSTSPASVSTRLASPQPPALQVVLQGQPTFLGYVIANGCEYSSWKVGGVRVVGDAEAGRGRPDGSEESSDFRLQVRANPLAPRSPLVNLKSYLTTMDVAQSLKCSVSTLKRWRRRLQGPPWVLIGFRSVRYPAAGLEAWMSSRARVGGGSPASQQTSRVSPGSSLS